MIDLTTLQAFAAYGVMVAFVVAFLERIILIVPSYVLFVGMGSILVNDIWDLFSITFFASIGSTLGAALWFMMGNRLGEKRCRNWVNKYQNWLFFSIKRYDRLVDKFSDNANGVVFFSQTIPTVRIIIPLPAGVIQMQPLPFFILTFLGCALWNGSLILSGAYLKQTGMELSSIIMMTVGFLLIVETMAYLIYRKIKRSHMSRQPSTAYIERLRSAISRHL